MLRAQDRNEWPNRRLLTGETSALKPWFSREAKSRAEPPSGAGQPYFFGSDRDSFGREVRVFGVV
jgi:hypothetical protein